MKKIIAIMLVLGFQILSAQQKKVTVKEAELKEFDIKTAKILDEDSNVVPPEPNIQHDENYIYNAAELEQLPTFPGGLQAFYKIFAADFKMPADKPDLTGRIFVTFVVEKDGMLSDIKILRDLGYGTGAEAVRVIKKLPKWIPGYQNGKAVRCQYSIPIRVPYVPDPNANKNTLPIRDK
jgi:periplasmic protein TonB